MLTWTVSLTPWRIPHIFAHFLPTSVVTTNFLAEGMSLSLWTRADSFPVGDVVAFRFPCTSSAQRVRPPDPSPRPHARQPALPAMLTTRSILLGSRQRFFCALFYGAVSSSTNKGREEGRHLPRGTEGKLGSRSRFERTIFWIRLQSVIAKTTCSLFRSN